MVKSWTYFPLSILLIVWVTFQHHCEVGVQMILASLHAFCPVYLHPKHPCYAIISASLSICRPPHGGRGIIEVLNVCCHVIKASHICSPQPCMAAGVPCPTDVIPESTQTLLLEAHGRFGSLLFGISPVPVHDTRFAPIHSPTGSYPATVSAHGCSVFQGCLLGRRAHRLSSPTWTVSAGCTPNSCSAASKMTGFGFSAPTCASKQMLSPSPERRRMT